MTAYRRNRTIRRTLFAIVGVLWLAVVVKLAAMAGLSTLVDAEWQQQDYRSSQRLGELELVGNAIEQHKAHFNLGTARAALGDLEGARSELDQALVLAGAIDECVIRRNLGLVLEATASASKDAAEAETLRSEARDAIDAAPGTCPPGPFAALQKRLGTAAGGKQDPAQQPTPDSEPKPGEGDQPGQAPESPEVTDALKQIEARMGTGQQEQRTDHTLGTGPKPLDIPKPW